MSLHRIKALLAAWILTCLTAAPVFGQTLRDMQPFAPAEMSTYGGGYRPNEGFFFSFDGTLWWIMPPDKTLIGDPTTRRVVIFEQIADADADGSVDDDFTPEKVVEFSTLDTGFLGAKPVGGNRYDFGYVDGHHGWLGSACTLFSQNQRLHASDAHVVFDDAPFGGEGERHLQGYIDPDGLVVDDLPVRFDELIADNQVKTWGIELNYLYRMHPNHYGGIFELFLGARYLEFDERFTVQGLEFIADPLTEPASGLGDSLWRSDAENHIVGPQIGGRWFRKTGRWTWSTEGRFFAGFNSQNIRQRGTLGSNLDPQLIESTDPPLPMAIRNMSPTTFNHTRHFREWSPAAELRVDLRYQLTRAVSARVGWTGMWIDGIARASNLIDYSIGQDSAMGITGNNNQDLFMHALSVGIELNR